MGREEEINDELKKLDEAITANESLKGLLPPPQLQMMLSALHEKRRRLEADLRGDGAIAQGDSAVALGSNAQQVGGNVLGDILGANAVKIALDGGAGAQAEQAKNKYLTMLARRCQSLPLAALGGDEGTDGDVTLDQVYTDLLTLTRREEKQQRKVGKGAASDVTVRVVVTALEAATQSARVVLLGDPGAGKSTFVHKLVSWQASATIKNGNYPPNLTAAHLPVLVTMRDLIARLPQGEECERLAGEVRQDRLSQAIFTLILDGLAKAGCEAFSDRMRAAIEVGECLLVMDGLDEVPERQRAIVREASGVFIKRYQIRHVIVTCRKRAYVGAAVFPDFQPHVIAPFIENQIKSFARAWYKAQWALGRYTSDESNREGESLGQAALSKHLAELSSNPMMLTTMAIIHQRETELPRERVLLYHLAVEVLLLRWQRRKAGGGELVPSAKLDEFLKTSNSTVTDLSNPSSQPVSECDRHGGNVPVALCQW